MYTDWLLIRRLAQELDRRLRGARVQDVGRLDDGRFALALWRRGDTRLVCIDVFALTPIITLESGELPIAAEPGFVRAVGAALRGTTVTGVRSRRGDRLVRFDFATRSRFGVRDELSLICELVPRFGNIVLLKGDTVVAATKEFTPSENAVRSVQAGHPYEPPPLRRGAVTPLLPDEVSAPLAEQLPDSELYVYRKDGKIVQAHVVPIPKYAGLHVERAHSLLDLFAEVRQSPEAGAETDRGVRLRRDIARSLTQRERKIRAELAQVAQRLRESQDREDLRVAGDAIYATLHELAPNDREEAKDRAAKLFAKYRKAAAAGEHLERRRADLEQGMTDLSQLRWDLDNAADADLDDVAAAIGALERHPRSTPRELPRRRKPLQYATPNGSRIYVGRTPIENAELTFRLARPDDLWFHVQNQPGAHVILQRDDRSAPPEADLITAAALAALHSKAKTSPKVTVDYTKRKHVRKRPSAAPGLVFYTNPKSLYVSPAKPPEQP